MNFAALDIVLALIICIFTARAALRGFVREAGGLAAWVFGVLCALSFYQRGAAYLRERWLGGMELIPEILAALALFALVFLAIKLLGNMLDEIILRLNLSLLDKGLGFLFGVFEGIVVSALIVFIITKQPLFDKDTLLKDSFFAALLGGRLEAAAGMIGHAVNRGMLCSKIC